MSLSTISQHEIDYSVNTFTSPESYAPFSHGPRGLVTLGCIDPRPTSEDCMPVIMQAAGGEAARGFEEAVVEATQHPEIIPKFNKALMSGLIWSEQLRKEHPAGDDRPGLYVPQVHVNTCRFIKGLSRVAGEMATPSQVTLATVRSFSRQHDLREHGLSEGTLQRVSNTTMRLLDLMEASQSYEADIVSRVLQSGSEGDPNVVTALGENNAALYIFNHTHDLGLNRQRVHRDLDRPVVAQAYHVTLGATVKLLDRIRAPKDKQALRVATHILRAASVRTVLTDPEHTADMYFYVVDRAPDGSLRVLPEELDIRTKWELE
jgi:gamma-glutamylcyclotransferase (GGCT)/AIG2-like uncharacterized protein YtfP